MLTIRLSRTGKRNRPMYRMVVSEKARIPRSRSLEFLGSYNPHTKDLQVKTEQVKYWLNKGAKTSPTVNNLLISQGIIKGEKVKASKNKKKKKEESKEKTKESVIEERSSEGEKGPESEKEVEKNKEETEAGAEQEKKTEESAKEENSKKESEENEQEK